VIHVTIWKNREDEITGFSVEGHSGYEESGKDIICASVSTLFYTAVNALEDQLGWKDCYRIIDGDTPFTEVKMREIVSAEEKQISAIIFRTICIGLTSLQEQVNEEYGGKYLQVKTKKKSH